MQNCRASGILPYLQVNKFNFLVKFPWILAEDIRLLNQGRAAFLRMAKAVARASCWFVSVFHPLGFPIEGSEWRSAHAVHDNRQDTGTEPEDLSFFVLRAILPHLSMLLTANAILKNGLGKSGGGPALLVPPARMGGTLRTQGGLAFPSNKYLCWLSLSNWANDASYFIDIVRTFKYTLIC